MRSLSHRCEVTLTDYFAGLVESGGMIYSTSPSLSSRQDGHASLSPLSSPEPSHSPAHARTVHLAPLWAYIPRDPVLWERLHKLTAFSLGLSGLLLLMSRLLPLRLLATVIGAIPLYVVLPLLGLVWYPKVFTEGRCLRRGQYHVNRRSTSDVHSGGVTPCTEPVQNVWQLPGLFWHLLTNELPPSDRSSWVRGDVSLPFCHARPIGQSSAARSAAPLEVHTGTSRSVQTSYQQTDKNAALLLFSLFIMLVEAVVPVRVLARGCGMFMNALLYAFYVFDYRYVQDGATVSQQVADFDAHTAYYCGYGTLSVLCLYGVSWLTGNAMIGSSLNFGLYGWHVAFSDYVHRRSARAEPHGTTSVAATACAAPFSFLSADMSDNSEPLSRSTGGDACASDNAPMPMPEATRGLPVLTWWFTLVRSLIDHGGLVWRCVLIFVFTTMIVALH